MAATNDTVDRAAIAVLAAVLWLIAPVSAAWISAAPVSAASVSAASVSAAPKATDSESAVEVTTAPLSAVRPWAPSASAASARDVGLLTDGNLLTNPGFEGGYVSHGVPELSTGFGWSPWFDGRLLRPEYKGEAHATRRDDGSVAAFSIRVFHGESVQKLFTSSGIHDAGVYQRVRVPMGEPLRFSVWAHTWSSDCDDPCVSPREPCRGDSPNHNGNYRVSVGIDPTGAEPVLGAPASEDVVWSSPVTEPAYDGWVQLAVTTTATSDWVTVLMRGHPEWPVKHNDSYWDDARLELVNPRELNHRIFVPAAAWTSRHGGARLSQAADAAVWALGHTSDRTNAPAPPGTDLRIEYPIRAFPDQENFGLSSCSDLGFESVLIANYGLVSVDLKGWTLEDREGHAFTFPGVVLDPRNQVRVWTRSGDDSTDARFFDVYWGRDSGVWDGPGPDVPWDVATLRDDTGAVVAERGYP